MVYIGVVILIVNGFVGVMNVIGDIDSLVKSLIGLIGNYKLISIIVMYFIGFIVILGIGFFFVIIFIIVLLFIFFGVLIGLDIMVFIVLIGIVSVLGDLGFLVSDFIFGLIVGLNIDG